MDVNKSGIQKGVSAMYDSIKAEMAVICKRMWQRGWAAANDGNLTVKVAEGQFLATQTGISKADITPGHIGLIDAEIRVLDAAKNFRPSSEIRMHLRVYAERPDAGAVVHAHPPYATGFACAHLPLDDYSLTGTVVQLGAVPLVPYAEPSTDAVPEAIAPFLASHDALLLANHGALTVGTDLTAAYYRMETLEQQAHISLITRLLGGAEDLPRADIDRLIALRQHYGLTGRHPGYEKLRP